MDPALSDLGCIGVLMGGCSSEREISLKSGKAVHKALTEIGCNAQAIVIESQKEENIIKLLTEARLDVAFIALHGRFGEDGTVQAILEKMGIPYTGPGVLASQRAINKITTQTVLQKNGVPVADFIALSKKDKKGLAGIADKIKKFPVVVKPAQEGSSIGVTLVRDKKDLKKGIATAFEYDSDILIESYVKGREMTVGILGDEPLPIVEIKTKAVFFDFQAKYQSDTTEYIVPADLPLDLTKKIQQMALKAFRAIGGSDFSRIDFILDENNNPFVLEINTIPGFTSHSLLPKAAAVAGYNFSALCLKIIQLAYAKKAKTSAQIYS
jgi:D-alanine-D-alanine ligase